MCIGTGGLEALVRDAVVSDHGSGEADDLLRVARVSDDLLVAAHGRGEDGLAVGDPRRANGPPPQDGAVLEDDEVPHAEYAVRPAAIVSATVPCRVAPRSHEFADLERNPVSLGIQVASRSRSTRFAGAPTAIRGHSRP